VDEAGLKRVELLQNIITRMAQNSFTIKGWAVTVLAALFALGNKEADLRFVVLAVYPALTFWGLDAYYLMQERLFRKLSQEPPKPGQEFRFTPPEATPKDWVDAALSVTVWPIYGFSLLMFVVMTLIALAWS